MAQGEGDKVVGSPPKPERIGVMISCSYNTTGNIITFAEGAQQITSIS
jgi:hypothetical protein